MGCTRACSWESRRPPKPLHGVRLLALVLICLDGVTDRIGPSEGPGPGSNPGRDIQAGKEPSPIPMGEGRVRAPSWSLRNGSKSPHPGPLPADRERVACSCGGFERNRALRVCWNAWQPSKLLDEVRILGGALITSRIGRARLPPSRSWRCDEKCWLSRSFALPKSMSSECGGSHTTLRRSKTRFESWRGQFLPHITI
jgi:hypothetical protein